MMENKTTILSSIFSNRKRLEAVVSLNLLKNPSLFDEYRLTDEDFKDKDAKQITRLASLLQTVDTVDVLAIDMIFDKNKELKEYFDDFGGSQELMSEVNRIDENNFEVFYEELIKQNYIMELKKLGFDVDRYMDKFKDMNVEDIKDWLDVNVINIEERTTQLGRGLEINDFDLTDEMIEEIINGTLYDSIQFSDYCPILNSLINGITLGTGIILSAPSGRGKSTFVVSNMLYPILKQGEKIVIVSNEMTFLQYMQMYISVIATREFKDFTVTRTKTTKGTLENGREKLKKIQSYIRNELKKDGGNIKFVNYNTGEIDTVIRTMKKLSKLGYTVCVFDTMKAENSADSKAWAKIIEDSKKLIFTAQEVHMGLIMPFQTTQSSENKRSLSRADLSEGKGIITVVSVSLMFRPVKSDEFDGGDYALNPYKLIKNSETDKWEKVSIPFKNDGKHYIVLTIDKNRFGEDGVSILYQFDGSHAIYKEIGMCTTSPDYK